MAYSLQTVELKRHQNVIAQLVIDCLETKVVQSSRYQGYQCITFGFLSLVNFVAAGSCLK